MRMRMMMMMMTMMMMMEGVQTSSSSSSSPSSSSSSSASPHFCFENIVGSLRRSLLDKIMHQFCEHIENAGILLNWMQNDHTLLRFCHRSKWVIIISLWAVAFTCANLVLGFAWCGNIQVFRFPFVSFDLLFYHDQIFTVYLHRSESRWHNSLKVA